MKLAIGVMCVISFISVDRARANCDQAPPRPATIDVYECSSIDRADEPGVIVTGAVAWSDGKGEELTLWLPSTEKIDCTKLPTATQLDATVDKVCCRDIAATACNVGATAAISHVKLRSATWAKKASRPQLESEVARLRAENIRLRAELLKFRTMFKKEIELRQQENKKLGAQLK
jgi:hypothetical protein